MANLGPINLDRVRKLKDEEDSRFIAERPRSMELLERGRSFMPDGLPNNWFRFNYAHPPVWVAAAKGARFTDVDGHSYLDFFLGISGAYCGHAAEAVTEAVALQAARGVQFQLPVEDAIWVAEELSRRYAPLRWQFALTSSQSLGDCIRLARAATGRNGLLKFDSNYHGHLDHTMVVLEDGVVKPEYRGMDVEAAKKTRVIQFNDVDALEAALASREVACVIAEPAMTNCGHLPPVRGYHEALRALTRQTGTLLLIDETQTFNCGFGGLTIEYGLEPDLFVVGKSIAGGVPFSAYGMNEDVAALIEAAHDPYQVYGEPVDEIATGGTMWANALTIAAARAALEHVYTYEAFEHARTLGAGLADGIERALRDIGLDWVAYRLFTRTGYSFSSEMPRNAIEARAIDVTGFKDAQRVHMANRGVWDGGWWNGPLVSPAHTADDIDRYIDVFREFLSDAL